jgi:predicted nucleic acid-binding protein
MKTIPDSNVLFDIILRDATWCEWASQKFLACKAEDQLVVNTIVFAEVGGHFTSQKESLEAFQSMGSVLEEIPWDAAYLAGRAYRAYRRSGGSRDRLLPDFLIGAHAATKGYRILTRDQARYRTYFPDVEVIAPDTHP